MVHSLYGWVERVHTSPKVGYSPSPKRERERERKHHSQLAWESLILRQLRRYFRGPTAAGRADSTHKKTGWLTVAVRLNGKNEETILQPAWAVWGYLLSNVLLLLSSHNRTKSDLVWIWVLGTLGLIDSTIIILRPPFFFLSLRNFVCRRFQNNWIEPREGAAPSMNHGEYLNSSYWQLLRVQLVFGQSLNYFQAVKLWMRMRN